MALQKDPSADNNGRPRLLRSRPQVFFQTIRALLIAASDRERFRDPEHIIRQMLLHLQSFCDIKIYPVSVAVANDSVALSLCQQVNSHRTHHGCVDSVLAGRASASLHVAEDSRSCLHSCRGLDTACHGSRMSDAFGIDDNMMFLASPSALNNIIEYKNVESLYSLLVRYFSAITHLDKNPTEKFDLRTIGRYYAIISGEDFEEFSFRKTEIQAASQRLLINREYEGAPVSEIPFLMNNLINYVNNSKDSFITKVAVVTYLIKYIKPFEKYNEEMAAILSKLVVSISDVESAAAYIPLESIILDEGGKLAEVNREIQRSRDLTYQLTRVIDMFNDALDTVADRIVQVSAKELSNSATFGEDKKEFEAEFGFEPSREIIDEVKPVEQPKVEPQPVETPVVKKPVVHKPIEVIVRPQEEDDGPSDKQLRRMAQNLLEEDPLLKKGQAHFYVRHCTKGKYYTIQQYKKCEGCVYETARTSMDNLARLGYYRREQVKNKFVYTPIDKE